MCAFGRLLILILLANAIHAVTASAGADDSPWGMRWRTYCDQANGVTFRYPYDYQPRDQYRGELMRRGSGRDISSGTMKEVVVNGKKVYMLVPNTSPKHTDLDVRVFSAAGSEIPPALGANPTIEAIGNNQAGEELQWRPYDYYKAAANRQHADRKWAPEGISAAIGEGRSKCAIVIIHDTARYAGLILKGKLSEHQNTEIIDTFEILSNGLKPTRTGASTAKAKPLITWRDNQFRAGKVVNVDGRVIAASQSQPNPWSKAWEVETSRYHITGNFSPARLNYLGQYFEALFKAYAAVFQPDAIPPYKLEVHVFAKADEFEEAARRWIDPNFKVRGGGGVIGGFFVPSLLSLWVYEESAKLVGGEHFSVEHVAAHECSHQFLHVTCNGSDHVPTWINEGIAVYFEAGVFQNGRFINRPPQGRIDRLKRVYSEAGSTLIPLERYLDHHGHINADSYGEVYAMTHFWVFRRVNGKQEGRPLFAEFWKALKNKEDGNKAFERIFMQKMVDNFGSRELAIAKWREAFLLYVKNTTHWTDSGG